MHPGLLARRIAARPGQVQRGGRNLAAIPARARPLGHHRAEQPVRDAAAVALAAGGRGAAGHEMRAFLDHLVKAGEIVARLDRVAGDRPQSRPHSAGLRSGIEGEAEFSGAAATDHSTETGRFRWRYKFVRSGAAHHLPLRAGYRGGNSGLPASRHPRPLAGRRQVSHARRHGSLPGRFLRAAGARTSVSGARHSGDGSLRPGGMFFPTGPTRPSRRPVQTLKYCRDSWFPL